MTCEITYAITGETIFLASLVLTLIGMIYATYLSIKELREIEND